MSQFSLRELLRDWKSSLRLVFFILLIFGLFFSARKSWLHSTHIDEFAVNCDEFGYLMTTKSVKESLKTLNPPDFLFQSSQTADLISFLQSTGEPSKNWLHAVGPHSYHFSERLNQVIPQYPPGTALILAFFPEGRAVSTLNQVTIALLFFLALGGIAFSYLRISIWSAGLIAFSAHEVFVLLERIQTRSFSINALILPTVFSVLFALIGRRLDGKLYRKSALVLYSAAGLLSGLCILIRITSFLQLPGMVLLAGKKGRRAYIAATALFGFLPLALHQNSLTGSPFQSTYAGGDTARPTLLAVWNNLLYYSGIGSGILGSGGKHNWAILGALFALVGFRKCFGKVNPSKPAHFISVRELTLAALTFWTIPFCFFLTHTITTPYYLYPPILSLVWTVLIGLTLLDFSKSTGNQMTGVSWPAYVPGVAVVVWGLLISNSSPPATPVSRFTGLPAELSRTDAWIWADRLTGSFWYYDRKPAFKIFYETTPQLRAKVFRHVQAKGGVQYLVLNREDSLLPMTEIRSLGGTLTPKGKIFGETYYQIDFPH